MPAATGDGSCTPLQTHPEPRFPKTQVRMSQRGCEEPDTNAVGTPSSQHRWPGLPGTPPAPQNPGQAWKRGAQSLITGGKGPSGWRGPLSPPRRYQAAAPQAPPVQGEGSGVCSAGRRFPVKGAPRGSGAERGSPRGQLPSAPPRPAAGPGRPKPHGPGRPPQRHRVPPGRGRPTIGNPGPRSGRAPRPGSGWPLGPSAAPRSRGPPGRCPPPRASP